jgi:hypothetical protein
VKNIYTHTEVLYIHDRSIRFEGTEESAHVIIHTYILLYTFEKKNNTKLI